MEFEERIAQMRDIIERADISLDSSKYEPLLKAASLTKDWNLLKTVEKILAQAKVDLDFSEQPKLKIPDRDDVSGDITIGTLDQDATVTVGLKLEDISRGVAIVGPTGSGKTTLIINLMRQLLDYRDSEHPDGIPFLTLDFKQDYRHIKDTRIRVIRWESLRLSLFRPPRGVNPKIFVGIVADIQNHVFGMLYASVNLFIQSLHTLFEKYGWKDYPTFDEVLNLVESMPVSASREAEYKAVIRNRLSALKMTLGPVIDCKKGISIEDDVLSYPTIIELDGCQRDSAHFLAAYLVAYIAAYRLYNNMRGSLESAIIFDEATRLYFDRSHGFVERELGASFLDTAPQYVRDCKIGMIFGLQEPSLASRSLWANSNTKIVSALSDGEDIEKVVEALYLTKDYEQEALSKIPRGVWLMKKPGSDAFLVKTEDYPLVKDVTTDELQERMKPILNKMIPNEEKKVSTEQKLREITVPELTQDAYDLLRDIARHPILGITGHAKSLKISIRRMERAKEQLLKRKLIEEKEVSFGISRPVKFLIPIDLGLQVLKDLGVNTRMLKHILTQGVSFEHVIYQVLISYAYRNLGYTTKIEHKVGNRRVDVWVEGKGETIAVEVEISTIGGISDKLDIISIADRLVLVFKDRKGLEESKKVIERRLGSEVGRIELRQVGQYLEELRGKKGSGRNGRNS